MKANMQILPLVWTSQILPLTPGAKGNILGANLGSFWLMFQYSGHVFLVSWWRCQNGLCSSSLKDIFISWPYTYLGCKFYDHFLLPSSYFEWLLLLPLRCSFKGLCLDKELLLQDIFNHNIPISKFRWLSFPKIA